MSDENDLRLQVAILKTRFDAFEAKAKEDSEFLDKKIDDNHDELTLKLRHSKGNSEQRLNALSIMMDKKIDALDVKTTKRVDDFEVRVEKRFSTVDSSVEKKLAISDFQPIKNIVYGLVAIILTVFATAVAKFFIVPDVAPKS